MSKPDFNGGYYVISKRAPHFNTVRALLVHQPFF